ncbi:unnamed protein product [Prunus armeniaca]|uniref:Uncharacterized protein n=1 Tax=Prunus armeniaca TaxID=36596 RepID=A0A6J5XFW1_PRUAR|nr:unnamed protein product [Prunus armeniaca]
MPSLLAILFADNMRRFHGGDREVLCVKRNLLLEALANELPSGTIRFSSKVVSVDESGYFKLVHLADGTILKAKPAFTGRSAIGGRADFKRPHGFDPIFMRFFGNGVRSGVIPCDDKTVYTWVPSSQDR